MAAPERGQGIRVELIYALPGEQSLLKLELPAGSRVGAAIEASGLLQRYPQIDLSVQRIGIFSRFVTLDESLHDGDRIEIYRALAIDPKDARRSRAGRRRG